MRPTPNRPFAHTGPRALLLLALALGFASVPTGCATRRTALYPIGIYGVGDTNDLATVRAAGFNLVTGPANAAYLDAARAADLRVLASPHTSAGPHFDAAAARRAVSHHDAHPALWAWYLIDEPDLNLVPPDQVRQAQRFLKSLPARKPTALVIFQGAEALHYANITDVTMIDRYPVSWLPLANFNAHVAMTRLALGPRKPLIAVIQAFDWSYFRDVLQWDGELRPPNFEELRCMTYGALAERANGLFYYSFKDSRWDLRAHAEVWDALQAVVREVNERQPLFQAEHLWWRKRFDYGNRDQRFNEMYAPSVSLSLLRVRHGNAQVPPGHYVLAVNTTRRTEDFMFVLPWAPEGPIPVLGEDRQIEANGLQVRDEFLPYSIRVYGPLPGKPVRPGR